MNQKTMMAASKRVLLADRPPNSLLLHRTFSTLLPDTNSFCVRYADVCSRFAAQNSQYRLASQILRSYCFINIPSIKSVHIRNMSSFKEPPEFTRGNPRSVQKEDPEREIKENQLNSGMANLSGFAREKGLGLDNHLSMKSSYINSGTTHESIRVSARSKEVIEPGKPDDWNDILNRWYTKYQDFIGITDLKRAQDKVTELSEGLLDTQSRRRNLQAEMEELQAQLTLNHQRITKAELYSEEHQRLFDEARDMNSRLKYVRSEFASCERLERDTFTQLSAAIRDCHERERTQAEQSKYWSIIASIVSAALASVITSVNNWVRIREIKDHVSSNNQQLLEGYQKMHEDVVGAVTSFRAGTASGIVDHLSSDNTGKSPPILADKDVTSSSSAIGELLKEQIEVALTKETKYLQEAITPHLDAITLNLRLILEGNRKLADSISAGNVGNIIDSSDINTSEVILPPLPQHELEKAEVKTVVVDYSYRHIATAMAVGAGIGTLATAFLLGSFSGGAVE